MVQQLRTRRGRQKYGQDVEPIVWFVAKLVLISAAIAFFTWSLASYKGIPVTLIILAVLVIGHSADLGWLLGDRGRVRPRAVVVFVLGFWILDVANNMTQGPC